MLRIFCMTAVLMTALSFVGCEQLDAPTSEPMTPTTNNNSVQQTDQQSGQPTTQQPNTDSTTETPTAPTANNTATGPETAPAPQPETKPAEGHKAASVGDGKKGHYGKRSIFDHSIGSFFRTREKLAYDIQIPHAMNLYKAEHGNAPKTHEEFMEKIIKFNNIPLPELKEDCRYEYDPATETLMIYFPEE